MPAPCYGKYYVYSSSPALSHVDRPRKPKPTVKKSGLCTANHATNIRTRGPHEFYNMMWDPSVYRGSYIKTYQAAERDRCRRQTDFNSNVKRRKFPRKQKLIGGIEKHKLSRVDQMDKVSLYDMGMQTEQFLEELTTDVVKRDMCTQFEFDINEKSPGVGAGCILRGFQIGASRGIQTDSMTCETFDENLAPIKRDLSRKILEQSLFETTEEMEVEAIRKEKRKYMQMRADQLYEIKRLIDRKRIAGERRDMAMNQRRFEDMEEMDAECRLGAALFSAGHLGGMLPITLGHLKLEGYLAESGKNDIYENYIPLLDEEVRKSYAGRRLVSRNLLDELLHHVTTEREAEYALHEYWDPQAEAMRQAAQVNLSLTEEDTNSDKDKENATEMPSHSSFGANAKGGVARRTLFLMN